MFFKSFNYAFKLSGYNEPAHSLLEAENSSRQCWTEAERLYGGHRMMYVAKEPQSGFKALISR